MIPKDYTPQIPAVRRAYFSFSSYCRMIGNPVPTFEAYARMTKTANSVPLSGGTERPSRRSPGKDRATVRKQGAEYVICD